MFVKFLKGSAPAAEERYLVFKAMNGDLPSREAINECSGFLITGSPCDSFSNATWIVRLRETIVTLHALKKPLVGICFGHQIIAVALGGKVGRATSGDWQLGFKEIQSTGEGLLAAAGVPKSFLEMESHRDEVLSLPPGALLTATSDGCKVEGFQIPARDPHTIGFQFHPEFTEEYNIASIAYKKQEKWVSAATADRATRSIQQPQRGLEPNPRAVHQLIRTFLKQ